MRHVPDFFRRPRPEHAALLIVAAAVVLRLYHRAPTWPSSDAANLPDYVSWFVCRRHFESRFLWKLVTYRLGGVQPLVLYAQMSFLRAIRWHVTELTWESSQIAVSAASTYAAFLFCREVGGVAAGLSAAALLAVTPLGISLGRHLGAPWPYEQGFQYLILFLFVAYLRRPSRRSRIGFSFALAIYFWVGNQMLGILPVLAYALVAGFVERRDTETLGPFLRSRMTPWFALPAASLGVLLYATFVLHTSHLYHALFHKRHTFGFYLDHWLDDAGSDIGIAATYFALALVALGTATERRLLTQRRLPVVLFLAYSIPFWIAIPPGSTLTRGYSMYGVGALLLAACTAAFSPALRAARAPALIAIIGLLQVGESLAATYRLLPRDAFTARPFQGSHVPNSGIKAAAEWIRSRGRPTGAVFSDASGGVGLEPSVMNMYLRRPSASMNDAPNAHYIFAAFRKQAGRIQYLLVRPMNHELAAQYFPTFKRALDVRDGARGELLLSVYTRAPVDHIETIDVHRGDEAFRARYSMLCGR